ncbi:MAG: response regulator [Candidatus Marinimicrobia bacterium]|nr:response regulator [Candidatus Neomarinimicrobiota bacterium]MCF7880487.1 response regulator [Candidatus Neomarinimicrobiota bacterium]
MAYNILIVDDSSSMRKVMTKIIKMSNFPIGEYHEAENGVEGLEVCQENWIDVIVTDINMPEMDGLTFIQKLQADPALKMIPVVVVSTEGRTAVVEQARKLGVVQYLQKPFQPELISNTLKELLGENSHGTETLDTEEVDF